MRSMVAVLLMSATLAAHAAPPLPSATATPLPARSSGPSTDPWVDIQLADLDRYAARYQASFDDELVRYQAAPRVLITDLRKDGWSDSRIYAACVVARTSGRPCRLVADAWATDRNQRWDTIAARFGVSRGSPALERLRTTISDTYKRLGRPLAE